MNHLVKGATVVCLLLMPASSVSAEPDDLVSGIEPSAEIVGGITDAFLRNSQVSDEERQCLSKGANSFASSLTNACEQTLDMYRQFTTPAMPPAPKMITPPLATGIPAASYAATSATGTMRPQAPPASTPIAPRALAAIAATPLAPTATVTEGEKAVIAMELAASLSHVYKIQAKVAESCLKSDVMDEFERAEKHLSNMTYVSGRLLTEGVDVMDELSTAFESFERHNYRAFGKDLGTAGRKVLLAKHSGLADFTEPSAEAIEEVTEGLFASMFGKGYDLQIVTDHVSTNAPITAPQMQTAVPDAQLATTPATWHWGSMQVRNEVTPAGAFMAPLTTTTPSPATLNIDLHKCISENMPFWKSAWAPVWKLASAAASGSESEVPQINDLMVSMMDVQMAMTRCKITPEMEATLIDSIEAGKLHANLQMPGGNIKSGSVPSLLASALEDFRDEQWYAFGNQLGAAMQDLAVVTFNQKYMVEGPATQQHLSADGSDQFASRQSLCAVGVGTLSVGFLAMLAVVRGRRAVRATLGAVVSGVEFERLDRAPVLLDDDLEAIVE